VTINHTVTLNSVDTVKINVASGLVFVTDPSVTNIFPGDSINLYVPDVVNVRKIISGSTTNLPDTNTWEDITNHFVVDYGQKDDLYDHARLILKQGYPSPNAQLTVHVDFFEHSYPAGATFFSVDSYETGIYEAGTIPIFTNDTEIFWLRDCLDFRPTKRIATTDTFDTGLLPSPDASAELSVDYYLPRIDKLVLSKNKEFRIIKGISASLPIPPKDSDDAMTLYTIYLPPFVASIDDIRLKYNENRRYTMKDISQIDKRVQAVEFYTALNNVENQALADESKYADGTNKAKFGIIGEGFKNYNIADYENPDFGVSMVPGEMTPFIQNKAYGLKLFSTTGVTENKRTLSLNYTETPMVSQNVTSNKLISVQPFLFAQFIGDISLSPETDFWVSETLKPDVLRAPEIDDRVREIHAAEVAADRIIEPAPQVDVDPPSSNSAPDIIETPGDTPPASDVWDEMPVQNPEPVVVITPIPKGPRVLTPIKGFDIPDFLVPVDPPPPPPPAPIAPQTSLGTSGGIRPTFKLK